MYYHPNVRFVGVVGPFEMIKKKIIRDMFFIQTGTQCIRAVLYEYILYS